MEIELSSSFLRKAKKLSKKEKILLSQKVDIFRANPSDPRLKTHPLTGKLRGLLSFSLNYSKRITFLYIEPGKVLFFDIGSHDEVYR
ncbi:MAG: type II toxin-antitoxin system mRNA interferase toxin, RelE/StbE family [Candidatus Woesebacteria bacterium]|nr:type II toxin-antitoxin system mRNA interferase toxin, RelE/StbE family [Candidatus Woesebacteria bacterium]